MSILLDGLVAGPDQSRENPLGKRGRELHGWHLGDERANEADGSAERRLLRPRGHRRVSRIRSEARRTILYMLTVAEAADRVGKDPETVRRWIRSGRLRARRVGRRHAISDQDLRAVEDELFPMAELPDEWKVGDDGSPAPNWVAALHRSRRDH